jgi:hypothetical protein
MNQMDELVYALPVIVNNAGQEIRQLFDRKTEETKTKKQH